MVLIGLVGCTKPSSNAPAIPLTELINSPAKYDGATVLTEGVWFSAWELSTLHQSKDSWPNKDALDRDIWLTFDEKDLAPDSLPAVKHLFKDMSVWEKGAGVLKIHVEVEGVFRHKDNIWGRLPGPSGFGHMGSFNNEFRTVRLLSYKLVEVQNDH